MTQRSILLFPQITDTGQIDRFRQMFDPLAGKIPPHVTLVFPFESAVSPPDLAAHISKSAAETEPFVLDFNEPELQNNGYIWLPVRRGAAAVRRLHERLYTGLLSPFHDERYSYTPHLTIGVVTCNMAATAMQKAFEIGREITAQVEAVTVERILFDERSEMEQTIKLAKVSQKAAE